MTAEPTPKAAAATDDRHDRLIDQPGRVQALRRAIFAVADRLDPVVDLTRPYVDGLENLPRDGRFLLVDHNHGPVFLSQKNCRCQTGWSGTDHGDWQGRTRFQCCPAQCRDCAQQADYMQRV